MPVAAGVSLSDVAAPSPLAAGAVLLVSGGKEKAKTLCAVACVCGDRRREVLAYLDVTSPVPASEASGLAWNPGEATRCAPDRVEGEVGLNAPCPAARRRVSRLPLEFVPGPPL